MTTSHRPRYALFDRPGYIHTADKVDAEGLTARALEDFAAAKDVMRTAACMIRWACDQDSGLDALGWDAKVLPMAIVEDAKYAALVDALVACDYLAPGASTHTDHPGLAVSADGEAWAEAVMCLLGDQIVDPVTARLDDIGFAAEHHAIAAALAERDGLGEVV